MHRSFPFNLNRRCKKALALTTLALLAAAPVAAQNHGNVVDPAIRPIATPTPGRIAPRQLSDPDTDGHVILYRTARCGSSKRAAAFMQRNNIPFVERYVEANRAWLDEYHRLGGRGVPFMVFGSRTLTGYNEQLIVRYYREMSSTGGDGAPAGLAPRPFDAPGYRAGGHPPPPPVYAPAYPAPVPPPGTAGTNGPLPGDPLALRMNILNLYVSPDSDARVSVTLTSADRVVYLGETRNGMYRVASDKGEGWVNRLHVRSPRGVW